MSYFRFKLQLKFRSNKNFFSITVNFHTGCARKYTSLKLKFGKKKVIIRRGPLTNTFTSLSCLNHLSSASSMSLRSGLWSGFDLNSFCSNTLIILVMFLQIVWNVELMRPNSRHTLASFFSICYSSYHVNFSFDAHRTFLLLVMIVMLPRYHPPVSCRSRNVQVNFGHKVNYLYISFLGLELGGYVKPYRACLHDEEEIV
jgi:hypothetical protein